MFRQNIIKHKKHSRIEVNPIVKKMHKAKALRIFSYKTTCCLVLVLKIY